jgi:UDP-N-acetylmuramoyl-L-alanyl-D-glutamate--2,6-diaminopimelate ligase
MKLREIIDQLEYNLIAGDIDTSISGIELDSREINPGFAFVAIKGTLSDGHQFINAAIEKGANTIFCQSPPHELKEGVNYVVLTDTEKSLVRIAENFYNYPAKKIKITGVTGTNGKTTIASLLYKLFNQAGHKSGLISTVAYYIGDTEYKSTHTTPNVLKLNQLFAEMIGSGCEYCFMEVSSHAIDQNRIAGIDFTGAIFTNITHDHLDYHKTFKNYLETKKLFFDRLKPSAFALTNLDDKNGMVMLQNTRAKKHSYSCSTNAEYKVKAIESHIDGTLIAFDNTEVWTNFAGKFNVSNLAAVYAAALITGLERAKVLEIISTLKPVRGRFETIIINNITGIIDYAHTPDALENILNTILEVKRDNQNLITIVGAGGDRDKTKRPVMAKIAIDKSDKVILTSDNPRTENPESILDDMEAGLEKTETKKMIRITDRKEAIKIACLLAAPGDIILIAGKGHETYQEIKGVRYDFDDVKVFTGQMKIISE